MSETATKERRKPKRAPMGVKPEEFLADLRRVYDIQKEIGIALYRKHGIYSESSIIVKFGSWNRALIVAGLPTNYQTCLSKELLGADSVNSKRTTYPCWKCKKPFKGLGRRKGNWHCDTCTASINAQASAMGWMAC